MAITVIEIPEFDITTSHPITLTADGVQFIVPNKGFGSANQYFAIHFMEATGVAIAYGEDPLAANFIDMSDQAILEMAGNSILNAGRVLITVKGSGTVMLVSK